MNLLTYRRKGKQTETLVGTAALVSQLLYVAVYGIGIFMQYPLKSWKSSQNASGARIGTDFEF